MIRDRRPVELIVVIGVWLVLLSLVAVAAIFLENRLHRRRRAREEELHRQMGVVDSASSAGDPRGVSGPGAPHAE